MKGFYPSFEFDSRDSRKNPPLVMQLALQRKPKSSDLMWRCNHPENKWRDYDDNSRFQYFEVEPRTDFSAHFLSRNPSWWIVQERFVGTVPGTGIIGDCPEHMCQTH